MLGILEWTQRVELLHSLNLVLVGDTENKQTNTQSGETSNISNRFIVGMLEKDRVKDECREFSLRNNIQTIRSSREKQV